MTFTQLITEVQKVALKQHNVNSFSSEDVYEYWNRPHIQYASVNIGLESADRTENTIVYNCVLYYGDRLIQNASNKIAIQDDAVKVLQAIISNLPDNITYYTPINYTVFEQEFADYIAGAYCRVRLETEFDQGNCSLDDYIEELKTLYITENGIFNVSGYDQVNVNVIKGITEEECRDIIEGYNYATKDEIPSLDGYATTTYVNTELNKKQPVGDYALRSELPVIPSLDPYAKIVDVDASLAKKQDNISDLDVIRSGAALGATAIQEHQSLAGYATEQWVNNQHFLTEHQDLSGYALKSEIPSLDGYATEQWVEDKGYLTQHQDLSEYAKTIDVNAGLESKQDKGDYALRSELPDLSTYATKQYVQDKIIEAGGVTIEQVDTEIENKLAGKNYATKDEIPSLAGYATESWVENKGYLTEHQDLSEYAKIVDVDASLNKKQDNISDLDVIRSGAALGATAIQEHQSLAGYATENWVENKGYLTQHQDLSEYAKKSEIPSLDGYATTTYVNTELNKKQPVGDYALKSEIPSVQGLATTTYVNTEVGKKQDIIPDLDEIRSGAALGKTAIQEHQDLSGYALKSEIPSTANFVSKKGDTMSGVLNIGEFSDTNQHALRVRYGNQGIKIENNAIGHWTAVDGTSSSDSVIWFYKNYIRMSKDTYVGSSSSDDNKVATHKWVTDKGYLTSAMFQYDASTKTLNINI